VIEPQYLSAQEVAAYLGVSTDWVYEHAAAGELPSYKFGGHRRFRRDELDAWAEAQRQGPALSENHASSEKFAQGERAKPLVPRALSS